MMRLIGDIGGTNTRLALIEAGREWHALESFSNDRFDSLDAAIASYLDGKGLRPEAAAFDVAGPVRDGEARLTNRGWQISQCGLSARFGFDPCLVVNDFSGVALGIPALAPEEREQHGGGKADPDKPIAILGPGTGLGVGAIVPGKESSRVVVTEGGHVALAALDDRGAAIVGRLRTRFDRVSAERVLSGQGIENLYRAISELEGRSSGSLDAATICAVAMRGDDPTATEAMDHFFAWLGAVAGDLALAYGAFGGVYIAGGIVPRYLEALRASRFREAFEDKGRMRDYVAAIPVFVILHAEVELLGLAASLDARTQGRPWPTV